MKSGSTPVPSRLARPIVPVLDPRRPCPVDVGVVDRHRVAGVGPGGDEAPVDARAVELGAPDRVVHRGSVDPVEYRGWCRPRSPRDERARMKLGRRPCRRGWRARRSCPWPRRSSRRRHRRGRRARGSQRLPSRGPVRRGGTGLRARAVHHSNSPLDRASSVRTRLDLETRARARFAAASSLGGSRCGRSAPRAERRSFPVMCMVISIRTRPSALGLTRCTSTLHSFQAEAMSWKYCRMPSCPR